MARTCSKPISQRLESALFVRRRLPGSLVAPASRIVANVFTQIERITMEQHTDCSYCMCGTDNTLVDAFGIPMLDLPASKLILFKEQSHKGRVIVASKQHVDDISCMSEEDAAAFMADVRHVAAALHKAFNPDKINFGAYGDTMHHLHVHIVPKYKDDPFEFGDVFAMNPGRVTLEPAQYDEIAQAIIANL